MSEFIFLTGDFDGGNPREQNSIIQHASDSFTVIPFSEDEDPNYKFRLDVKVCNTSSATKTIKLTIDWGQPKFNYLRNYLYLKHQMESKWRYAPLSINSTQSFGQINFVPGETHICLHPKYNYSDYQHLITKVSDFSNVLIRELGKTKQGRKIAMVYFPGRPKRIKKKVLIVSRIHPYETAGSYCVEGIVDAYITGDNQLVDILNNGTDIYLIPMANPDGVFNGFCKRTDSDGLDVAKNLDFNDLTAAAIKKGVDMVRPDIYCEFHNWMFKYLDGIYYLNKLQSWKFKRLFPSQKLYEKKWRSSQRHLFRKIPHIGFKKYCSETFNSLCLALEFPWFKRSIEDMKRIGVQTTITLAKML